MGDRLSGVVFGEEYVSGVGASDHHGFCRSSGLGVKVTEKGPGSL